MVLSMHLLLLAEQQQSRPGRIGRIPHHFIKTRDRLRYADAHRHMEDFFREFHQTFDP